METSKNKFEIIHETISKADNRLSVKMLCEIAGVSRSGYYNWVHSAEKELKRNLETELTLKGYWRHTASEVMIKEPRGSI